MNRTSRIYRTLRCPTGNIPSRPSRVCRSILFFALLFALVATSASARQTTNLEQFQRCARIVADTLFARSTVGEGFCVRVVPHQADWLLDQAAIDLAAVRELPLLPCKPPYTNELLIAVTEIGVRYVELDDEDFYRREIRLGVSASVPVARPGDGKTSRATERFDCSLHDTIEALSIADIEAPGYNFTTGTTIRINRSSFWKSVAEPAIIVGTSVVMVILLFTTRSK